MIPRPPSIAIRPARVAEGGELVRLAALDSAAMPSEPVLVAKVDGQIWAALSLQDGAVIADPFHRTAELVELLRLRARQLPDPGGDRFRRPRGRRRLAPRLA